MAVMIRVSQSVHSGKMVSRRPVEIRFTKSGALYAKSMREKEERFWRDPLGVWRLKRPSGSPPSQFRVWLEEEKKDGN